MNTKPAEDLTDRTSPLWGFDFTRAWLDGNDKVRAALPSVPDLLKARTQALESGADPCRWQPWTPEEIQELKQFNLEAGNPAGASLCDRLSRPTTRVVVTGQQPNLLVSPLYILYKALSAVAWARKLSNQLGQDVLPVFWVASDDDDFAELKQASMPAWNGELIDVGRRISRGGDLAAGSPAYQWSLTESASRLISDVNRALKGWPQGKAIAEWLAAEIQREPNFERLYCHLLAELLGEDFPVIFVAPRLKVMRRRGAPVLSADLTLHGKVNNAVTSAADALTSMGYPVSLNRGPEALNMFWLKEGRRCRLIREGDQVAAIDPATQKEIHRFSEAELQTRLQNAPEEFAPNVVTRPVIQDTALPTLLYIGGPGELAYLAALAAAYDQLGCPRSAVAPRSFITINGDRFNNNGVQTWAEKEPDNLLMQNGTSAALQAELTRMTLDIETRLQTMHRLAAHENLHITSALEKTHAHVLRGIGQLKHRLAKQLLPEQWQQHARAATLYYPAGKIQERTLSPWTFVKVDQWDALAHHLYDSIDFTTAGPHTTELPPWIKGQI